MKTKNIEDFNSLIELMEYLPSEQSCIEYFQEIRWEGKPVCPRCNCEKVYRFSDNKRFKCSGCLKQFTVRIGTIFEDSNISLKKWFIAMYLILNHKKGISSHQLARDIKVTQRTAWFILHRIRFGVGLEGDEMLEGRIELDETFVGGKNKNRHADKKFKQCQGRSFQDKTPVMGMLQEKEVKIIERPHKVIPFRTVKEKVVVNPDRVICHVVSDTSPASLQPLIRFNIMPNSILISDEWVGYRGLDANYDHRIVDHTKKIYVNENGDTSNALEGFWTWVKKSYSGIYHHYSRKHMQAYITEVCFRYNTRTMKEGDRVRYALTLITLPLKYKQLIKKRA